MSLRARIDKWLAASPPPKPVHREQVEALAELFGPASQAADALKIAASMQKSRFHHEPGGITVEDKGKKK
ncbi:hypothetical protein [Kutzneria albida]|uniref:Uncharacterized protein n=1 Tax=Kutzneria albida DSM 43870 TaxID=1449976 RepID=W5WJB2_9PSEU|nr:hypothetical protein [Kutzneria albida]AHH98249.1 hypothetical protein KALB_4887 [Kutzneria albida DSM 43870]